LTRKTPPHTMPAGLKSLFESAKAAMFKVITAIKLILSVAVAAISFKLPEPYNVIVFALGACLCVFIVKEYQDLKNEE